MFDGNWLEALASIFYFFISYLPVSRLVCGNRCQSSCLFAALIVIIGSNGNRMCARWIVVSQANETELTESQYGHGWHEVTTDGLTTQHINPGNHSNWRRLTETYWYDSRHKNALSVFRWLMSDKFFQRIYLIKINHHNLEITAKRQAKKKRNDEVKKSIEISIFQVYAKPGAHSQLIFTESRSFCFAHGGRLLVVWLIGFCVFLQRTLRTPNQPANYRFGPTVHVSCSLQSATFDYGGDLGECVCVVCAAVYLWKNHEHNTIWIADQFSLLIVTCMESIVVLSHQLSIEIYYGIAWPSARPAQKKRWRIKTMFARWICGRTHRSDRAHSATHLWPPFIWHTLKN